MSRLLHVASSPRGGASESLRIADEFLASYAAAHPDHAISTWDLWDGSLPEFGPAAAGAKMTVFGGGTPTGAQAAAWAAAGRAFERLTAADHLLFSVPMWNGSIPYILKQLIDVVSQPGMIFTVDAHAGYTGLLAGRGMKATVIYTSAVWGPRTGPEFGRDFQAPYFEDWLRWTGIDDITAVHFHPTLTGDRDAERERALAEARAAALELVAV